MITVSFVEKDQKRVYCLQNLRISDYNTIILGSCVTKVKTLKTCKQHKTQSKMSMMTLICQF